MEEKNTEIKEQTIVFDLDGSKKGEADKDQSSLGSQSGSSKESKKPTCIIILGMAGSGKTTFVQRLASHLHSKAKDRRKLPYVINLDPACMEVRNSIIKIVWCI